MRLKLQPTKDGAGYYLELQAGGNHETLMTSEVYNTREAAIHAIALIQDEAPNIDWYELPGKDQPALDILDEETAAAASAEAEAQAFADPTPDTPTGDQP